MTSEQWATYEGRFRWAREQRKLSQQELAVLAGVSLATVNRQERPLKEGERRTQPLTFNAFVSALRVNPLWLREGIGEPHK